MILDFRNVNTLWASVVVATLYGLGLKTAVVCPGSRSTPLTVAFAQHPDIETLPILDERSAAFFALGVAKRSRLPTVLVCTSGTAGANFYSVVIEARYSCVPLLILTADRPPELRNCHAGQTIDQVRLYGNYPNWQTEIALPAAEVGMLRYLRQTIVQAWQRSLAPTAGVVHLNFPFRDPLAPTPDGQAEALRSRIDPQDFFANLACPQPPTIAPQFLPPWQQWEKGVIIAGPTQPADPEKYCRAIAHLSSCLHFPVLAEGLSPLRNYADLNPYLISTYDSILRNPQLAEKLTPEIVIQIGELPTSKHLRTWLAKTQTPRWIIAPSVENFDPLHGKTTHLPLAVEEISLRDCLLERNSLYLKKWLELEKKTRQHLDTKLEKIDSFFEGKIAWLLSQYLPKNTTIFIANSMPVRDVEFFWKPNDLRIKPFFSRGANGIDGTLSTALGVAYRDRNSVLLSGDLALLHDTNGFLLQRNFIGHLTIILINNQGGGIFEMLPISKFDPLFEKFFATPQNVKFSQICQTYNLEYIKIESWNQLKRLLNPPRDRAQADRKQGKIRLLEITTNRKQDTQWRQKNLSIDGGF